MTSGATITQRSGSSPSLNVSSPGRSLSRSWTILRSLGAHRLELDLLAGLERPLGGAVGLALDHLAAALAVAGGVDPDALAVAAPAEGGPVADQLHGVDRLAAAADQQAEVLAVDPCRDLVRRSPRRRPRPRGRARRRSRRGSHLDPRPRLGSPRAAARSLAALLLVRRWRRGRRRRRPCAATLRVGRRPERHHHPLLAQGPEVGRDPVDRETGRGRWRRRARTGTGART